MDFAFSMEDVDVCVVCVADKAPRLPLREELPSLGVEMVYTARGDALKISQGKARQDLKSYREAKALEDLTSRRLFRDSEANAQAELDERRRKEHELKTVHALTYEMYKDRLRNHTLYSEWDSSSESSQSDLEEVNSSILYAESREEEASIGDSAETPEEYHSFGVSSGRMSPPPIKGRVSEMVHLYGSISPVSSDTELVEKPVVAPKATTTEIARNTFVTKRYRNEIKDKRYRNEIIRKLTANRIEKNSEKEEEVKGTHVSLSSNEEEPTDKIHLDSEGKESEPKDENQGRLEKAHLKESAPPEVVDNQVVIHESHNEKLVSSSISNKHHPIHGEPKADDDKPHSFQRIKLRSVKNSPLSQSMTKSPEKEPEHSLDRKEVQDEGNSEPSDFHGKPVKSIEFPKPDRVKAARGSRVSQLAEKYGSKTTSPSSSSLSGQKNSKPTTDPKKSPQQIDSPRESTPSMVENRVPARSFKSTSLKSIKKEKEDVPETLFLPRLRKTGRVAQMVEKYSSAQVASSNEKSLSLM